jgi:1,4-alpha-glucan branching enzyme
VALDTSGFDEYGTPSQAGRVLDAQPVPADGQPYSVEVTVAKLSAVYLTPLDEAPAEPTQSPQPAQEDES